MLVSSWRFRGATSPVRAVRVMKAQRERCPVDVAGRSGGQAPAGKRKCYALQQKGKGQHRDGKPPTNAP